MNGRGGARGSEVGGEGRGGGRRGCTVQQHCNDCITYSRHNNN